MTFTVQYVVSFSAMRTSVLQALNTICDHVDDIEMVLRTELESGRGDVGAPEKNKTAGGDKGRDVIDRDAMARKLSRARGKEVSRWEAPTRGAKGGGKRVKSTRFEGACLQQR